jgi:hypothetical protein
MSVTGGVLASAALAGSVNTAAIQTNAVSAAELATNAIKLGFATLTAGNGTVTSATYAVFATNSLSVTYTMPTGGRDVKVTLCGSFAGGTSGDGYSVAVYEGNTYLGSATFTAPGNAFSVPVTLVVDVPAPSAGSHTYTVRGGGPVGTLLMLGGLGTTPGNASATSILVEAI